MIGGTNLLGIFSTGKPAIEPQLLSVEHFKNIRTPQECAALLKHAVEVVKSDQYMDAALRVVLRIASEKPTAGAELGDFGVCGLLDSVLGQKLQDPNLCRLTLEIILLLITQKGPDTGAQSQQRSIVLAAVAGMVGNADAQTNIRRLSTSATIFRIIKACHTHCSDASMILLGLKSLHYIISEAGEGQKLVSCGACDLLGLILRHHHKNEDIVILACQCINELVLFDLDDCGGSLGCQDKLSDSFVCDILMEKVLKEKSSSSTDLLGAVMKAIGTLARRHQANKEQLALSGACEVIPAHCLEENIGDASFAANVCWIFANLSFPDENNQSRLGSAGACAIVVQILKTHVDKDLLIQEGCRALHQLGELHDENLERFCNLGAHEVCMQLLRKYFDRDDVLQWIMYALATLAGSQHGLALMQPLDLEEQIVNIASKYVANEDLVQWTSMTIASLCDSEQMVGKLHELHCCQVLLQALGRHLNNPDVCEEVLRAMGSIATASMPSRHTFSENSVGDFVVKTLEQHRNCETVVEQGLYALSSVMYISWDGASKMPGISIFRAVTMDLDRAQQRVYKSMTYSCLLNGGMKLLCRSIAKFSEQNTTLTSFGVRMLSSLALGCKLLDSTRGDGGGAAAAIPQSESESSISRLGAAGAISAFCSVLTHHLPDKSMTFWCLFGLVQLATTPSNLALLGAADICTAMQRMLEVHLADADLLSLLFELIVKLCTDATCRSALGLALSPQPGEPHHQPHVIIRGIRLHLSVGRVVAAGCGAISALCISPNADALSSLFCAQEATRTLRMISSADQEGVAVRRGSGVAPTDWTTFGENVDHLNSVLPAEATDDSEGALAQDSPQPMQAQASLATNLLRRLSFWSSKKSDMTDASTTPAQRSSTPVSATYDQVQPHHLHSQQQLSQQSSQHHYHGSAPLGANISGQQFIMDAANSIISTGLSDQEERVIKALRQRANQRKASSDYLAEGGALQMLLQVFQSCNRSDSPYSLALALNALNSLCLHTPNRLKARELGLFESLAAVHARVADSFRGDGPRDLCGLEFDQLDEGDWVRVQLVLSSIALGTCCLADTPSGDSTKTVEQIAIVHTNQEVLGSLSVLENLAFCLSKSVWDVRLCEVSLRSLHLIVRGNESNQSRLLTVTGGEQSALYHVVNALREKMDAASIAYYACLAIAAIATDNKQNCDKLEEHGVCKVVLRTLVRYMDHEDVVEAACQAIHGLKPLNEALGQGGACEFVVRTLEVHASSPSVSEWVCRAIGSLAESQFNKIELEKHQITKVVTATLQRHVSSDGFLGVAFSKDHSSAGVAQWGCTAIYYLAKGYDAEGFQKRLVQAGACDAVARALTKYAEVEAVAYSCCRALVVLVDQNEALKSKPLLSGVCQYIVESLHLFPSSVLMAKWGCRAAAVLAESHEANIAKLGAAGACESIPLIIQSHPASEEVAVAGCKLIAFMSEQTSNGFAERFGHAGGCEAVVAALRKHMASAVATARAGIAINTLAMVMGNARWFGPAGACDALHAALLLHMGNARVAKFIVSAIGQLCIIEHNKERLGVLGVCEAVVQTAEMHAEDLDTAQSCADTIGKLCEAIGKVATNPRPLADSTLPEAITSDPHFLAGRRNRAVLFHCGACKFLVRALEHHLADVNAAQCICKAISIVASGESCSREAAQMGSLGACQAVSKAMTFHEGDEEVAMYSCFAVHALCMMNDSNKVAFYNASVCPVVVQVLRGFRHSPMVGPTEAAARAISALSASCAENKTMLGRAGSCEGLLECLELHMRSQELTFLLLKALFHVCDGNGANRTRVSFSGGPDILHGVLTRYMDEEKMADYSLSIMIGLSMDKVGQSKLGAAGVPKTLAAAMSRYEKSDHVSTLSLALIGAMCKGSRANQDKFGAIGIAKLIATCLSRYGLAARSESRVRGASIASGTRTLRSDPLVESRGPSTAATGISTDETDAEESPSASMPLAASPSLLHSQDADCTLVDYMGEVSAVKESCRALYYFCMNHEANRQKMLALGVMDLLTALVSTSMLGGADSQQDFSDHTKVWARNAMEVLMVSTRG